MQHALIVKICNIIPVWANSKMKHSENKTYFTFKYKCPNCAAHDCDLIYFHFELINNKKPERSSPKLNPWFQNPYL